MWVSLSLLLSLCLLHGGGAESDGGGPRCQPPSAWKIGEVDPMKERMGQVTVVVLLQASWLFCLVQASRYLFVHHVFSFNPDLLSCSLSNFQKVFQKPYQMKYRVSYIWSDWLAICQQGVANTDSSLWGNSYKVHLKKCILLTYISKALSQRLIFKLTVSDCSSLNRMDGLRLKLESQGLRDVSYMVINHQGERAQRLHTMLEQRLSGNIVLYKQEEHQPDVWQTLGGEKDDFFIYDRCVTGVDTSLHSFEPL